MNILVTNDDGFNADGIQVLKELLAPYGEVVILAPDRERSTTGHSLSLHDPLRLKKISTQVYSCTGYPADCTYLGINYAFDGKRPDLLFSGINRGANLGQDIYYSGTVAGAREAAFQNIPSVAMSLVIDFANPSQKQHYENADLFLKKFFSDKFYQKMPAGHYLNVNLPDIPLSRVQAIKYAHIGKRQYESDFSEQIDPRGRPYYWIKGKYKGFDELPDSDCSLVDQGNIAVTPLGGDHQGNIQGGFKQLCADTFS